MKSDKKISICIPVYNGANTIAELVEELIEKLSMYEIEIILINDGSSDDSEKICIDLYNKFHARVKHVNHDYKHIQFACPLH